MKRVILMLVLLFSFGGPCHASSENLKPQILRGLKDCIQLDRLVELNICTKKQTRSLYIEFYGPDTECEKLYRASLAYACFRIFRMVYCGRLQPNFDEVVILGLPQNLSFVGAKVKLSRKRALLLNWDRIDFWRFEYADSWAKVSFMA